MRFFTGYSPKYLLLNPKDINRAGGEKMAQRIPQEVIETVRSQTNIVLGDWTICPVEKVW